MNNNYLGYLFPATIATINDVQTVTQVTSTSGTGRSNRVFVPALSKLSLHFSATASVQVISNPFGDIAKATTLQTIAATGSYTFAAADIVELNITANTGVVSAIVINNTELD